MPTHTPLTGFDFSASIPIRKSTFNAPSFSYPISIPTTPIKPINSTPNLTNTPPNRSPTPTSSSISYYSNSTPPTTPARSSPSTPATTPSSSAGPKDAKSIYQVLREKSTAILVDTADGSTLSLHKKELAGSWLSLPEIAGSLESSTTRFHLWTAVYRTAEMLQGSVYDSEYFFSEMSLEDKKKTHSRSSDSQSTCATNEHSDGFSSTQWGGNCQSARRTNKLSAMRGRECYGNAMNRFISLMGTDCSEEPEGPHVTHVDPRNHSNVDLMVQEALDRCGLLTKQGMELGNVLVGIPATEAGLKAARILKKYSVNVNLYGVSTLLHATACAEVGAAAITIPVQEVLEWFERRQGNHLRKDMPKHPGIEAMHSIIAFFRMHNIKTRIIGTNFRKMADIALLSDFDAVCVSKIQMDRLPWNVARFEPNIQDFETATLRAAQARYPTALVDRDTGRFLHHLSGKSRTVITSVLEVILRELCTCVDKIERAVVNQVDEYFLPMGYDERYGILLVGKLSYEKMKRGPPPSSAISTQPRKKSSKKDVSVAPVPSPSPSQEVQDEDEVF